MEEKIVMYKDLPTPRLYVNLLELNDAIKRPSSREKLFRFCLNLGFISLLSSREGGFTINIILHS